MRTPAGTDCSYFYGNYYRGRQDEACRLLEASGQRWSRALCKSCPVPAILQANACEFLKLHGAVARQFSSMFQRRVQVSAYCDKVQRGVAEPQIGCGQCHPLPPEFVLHE